MNGERNIDVLLASMSPVIHPDTFVFATLPKSERTVPSSVPHIMAFQELEGLTVITSQAAAEVNNLKYAFPSRMVTLNVHSSLDAVGFLACILNKLKDLGIGVNPVSGFFHDHLFIPLNKENAVIKVLEDMGNEEQKMSD